MRRQLVPVLLVFLVIACLGATAAPKAVAKDARSQDWPQWRGPDRNAVSLEKNLIDAWGEEGPPVLWRSKVGEGFSSVVVSQGKLYTMWDDKGKQHLTCLDASTGSEVWRRELGPAFKNHYGNGPRSTPLVDGKIVYAIGTKGVLLAANRLTGEIVWQRDLVKDFGSDLPSYGYSSSPLVVGDKIVVEAGGADAAFVALNKATGKTAWTSENDRPAYSSPIAIEVQGTRHVVFWSAHGLHAVADDTGALLWKYNWETFCPVSGAPLNTGTPIFVGPDRVFLSSGSGAVLLRLSRSDGGWTAQELWKTDEMRSDVNAPVLLGHHIYGFDRGTLKSLDVADGEVHWKARGFQRGSIVAADGKLFVLGESGDLALLEANPEEYVKTSTAKVMEGRNWTSPTLAQGRLYLRNNDEIVCLDLKKR